jgi:hypothetical protein
MLPELLATDVLYCGHGVQYPDVGMILGGLTGPHSARYSPSVQPGQATHPYSTPSAGAGVEVLVVGGAVEDDGVGAGEVDEDDDVDSRGVELLDEDAATEVVARALMVVGGLAVLVVELFDGRLPPPQAQHASDASYPPLAYLAASSHQYQYLLS